MTGLAIGIVVSAFVTLTGLGLFIRWIQAIPEIDTENESAARIHTVKLAGSLVGLILGVAGTFLLTGIGIASTPTPPCGEEDGGPIIPCVWDGGVTENGYTMIIRYEPVTE